MKYQSVAILGAGAVGSYVMWGLAKKKEIDLCVVASGERKARYEKEGFVINGQAYHPAVRTPEEAAGVDLLIVATKYQALRPALGDIQTVTGEHTTVMSLMNGVESEEIIGEVIDPSQIVHSLIKVASERKGNQVVFNPETTIGIVYGEADFSRGTGRIEALNDLFADTGLHYRATDVILTEIWSKFRLNVPNNQAQAMVGCGVGAYRDSEHVAFLRDRLREEVDRIAEKKVAQFLGIYETSSPSYLLMAGIEKSLQIIEKDREMLFAAYSRRLAEFRDKTKNLKTLQVLQPSDFSKQEAFSFDPGKLLILTGNSMSGQALQEILLQEYGLQMEMASGNYVVAMTSIMDTDEGFARLSDALECIDGTVHKKEETSEISPREIYREQKTVMTIDQALDAEQKTVRLEEAAGAVSGDYVYLYPPGIPVLVPGEAIDVQTAETIRHCIRLGLEVEGLPDLTCINVVK